MLLDCLWAIRKQTVPVQAIYIVDNASTDGTPLQLLNKGYISCLPSHDLEEPWEVEFVISTLTNNNSIKLHYVRMHQNTGGAGGFYEGIKRGYGKGYDWLWIMDDDAIPDERCLETLMQYSNKARILAPLVIDKSLNPDVNHRGFIYFEKLPKYPIIHNSMVDEYFYEELIKIDFTSFVGPLIHRDVFTEVGFPDKRLFIYHDDEEFCMRVYNKFEIYLVKNAKIFHAEDLVKNRFEKKFLGRKSIRIHISNINKLYYHFRNLLYLNYIYSENKFKFYVKSYIYLLRVIGGILIYDDYKLKRISLLLTALKDFKYLLKGDLINE